MTPLAIDSLGWLGGLLAWLVLCAGILAFFRAATRSEREDFDTDHSHRSRVGIQTEDEWQRFMAEMEAKRARAEARHQRRAA